MMGNERPTSLPRERKWAHVEPDSAAIDATKRAIVLVTVKSLDDDQEHLIGTAFVVALAPEAALCFTAHHVLKEAVKRCVPEHVFRRLENTQYGPDPQQWSRWPDEVVQRAVQSRRIRLAIGAAHLARVDWTGWFSIWPFLDLAMVVVPLDEGMSEHVIKLPIDSSLLAADTEVMTVGVFKDPDPLSSVILSTDHIGLSIRAGRIESLEKGMVRRENYRTTIPVLGGMSGGPLLHAIPLEGGEESVAAAGIISSDFTSEPIIDTMQAGNCRCLPVEWADKMPVPIADGWHFLEMIARGGVIDRARTPLHAWQQILSLWAAGRYPALVERWR
jgi:hypothetical protein